MMRNYDKNRYFAADSQRKNIIFHHGPIAMVFLAVFMCSPQAVGQDTIVRQDPNPLIWRNKSTGFALDGFDPVAYFGTRGPLRGVQAHEYDTPNAAWLFVNKGNLEAFKRFREIYTPQFGGHAAYAMSIGRVVESNPMIWHISNNKIYLFYSQKAKRIWVRNEISLLELAEKNWQGIVRRSRMFGTKKPKKP